jgi:hypothetical protein
MIHRPRAVWASRRASGLLLCIPGACLLLIGAAGAAAAEPTVEQIVELWRKRQRLIKTAVWEWKGTVVLPAGYCTGDPLYSPAGEIRTNPKDFVYEHSQKLWIDYAHGRLRKETVGAVCVDFDGTGPVQPYLETNICVFDGNHTLVFCPRERNPHMAPDWQEVDIFAGMQFARFASDDFAYLAAGVIRTAFAGPNRRPLEPARFRMLGRARHEGRDCVLLRTELRPPSSYDELWVDVERDAAIVRLVAYGKRGPFSTCTIEYGRAAGTWMPTAYSFSWDDGPSYRMKVTRLEVNPRLDPELFRLMVEAGTKIRNGLTGQSYAAAERGDALKVRPMGSGKWRISYTAGAAVAIACLVAVRIIWLGARSYLTKKAARRRA